MPKGIEQQTFPGWVSLPENRAARMAVGRVTEVVASGRARRPLNPLFLHGPAGTGKSHLVAALVEQVVRQAPDRLVFVLAAGDFEALVKPEGGHEDLVRARQADLLAVEDLQHLPSRTVEAFVHLVDHGLACGQQQVFTASGGPAQLTHLPTRLTSRLAGGLVVGLLPLSPQSRVAFLESRAAERGLDVDSTVLAWLANHFSGSTRQLDGALGRLEILTRLAGGRLSVEEVGEHFRTEAEAGRPTVERIAQRVSRYFQVEPRQLQSRTRLRSALLPRQVGMYLARQLTGLSLQQIGAYFGGRDHSTVLHACRKVEEALAVDVPLSQAVRQLHADLA
jgi:chromosomal replication initiator protein